jgi:hypothetical protein
VWARTLCLLLFQAHALGVDQSIDLASQVGDCLKKRIVRERAHHGWKLQNAMTHLVRATYA